MKGGMVKFMDIGNRCVHCGRDTSFGSGRFVNRIPADADYEAVDKDGKIIFADGEYRDGYGCFECYEDEYGGNFITD